MGERVVLDRACRRRAAPRIPGAARPPRGGAPETRSASSSPSARCRFRSARPRAGIRLEIAAGRRASALCRGIADRRHVAGHAGEHLGDVAHLDRLPAARELAGDVQQAAEIAGQHRRRRRWRRCRPPCRSTILSEMSGYLTQNVPPKPQHTSAPGQFARAAAPRPRRAAGAAASLTPSSRKPGAGIVIGRRARATAPRPVARRGHRPETTPAPRCAPPAPAPAAASPDRRRTARG